RSRASPSALLSASLLCSSSLVASRSCATAFSAWSAKIRVSSSISSTDFLATTLNRGRRETAQLGIHRPENGVLAHSDLVGCQCNQGPTPGGLVLASL